MTTAGSDMDPLARIGQLLAGCASAESHLPPTTLYNEGWMLRLVLDWCASHPAAVDAFAFLPGARWYSEALLPSRFGGRGLHREGFTHADAVIGHFRLRAGGRGDIELRPGARQLSVVEAKMGSPLSAGTSNAKTYNQAARNVACMVHLIAQADGADLERISFTVVAPAQRIAERIFEAHLTAESLLDTVRARSSMFDGAHEAWFAEHFEVILPRIVVEAVSWESVVASIASVDGDAGGGLGDFLARCLRYNTMPRPRQ
jgi:hypothetical protein